MKKRIFGISFFLLNFVAVFAQQQDLIIHSTPEAFYKHVSITDNKATILQFYNPNCEDAQKIIKQYQTLQDKYSGSVDFYFIAVTSKDKLLTDLAEKTYYKNKMYMIDASVAPDLYERRQVFCKKLSKLLQSDNEDFITLCMDKMDKLIYVGDDINITPDAIEKLF